MRAMVTITIPREVAEAAWEAMGVGLRSHDGQRQDVSWQNKVYNMRSAIDDAIRVEDQRDEPAAPLVRFTCGCIGFRPVGPDSTALLVYACDGDGEPTALFYRRPNNPETFTPLTAEETATIVAALQKLVGNGYRYRELAALLRMAASS